MFSVRDPLEFVCFVSDLQFLPIDRKSANCDCFSLSLKLPVCNCITNLLFIYLLYLIFRQTRGSSKSRVRVTPADTSSAMITKLANGMWMRVAFTYAVLFIDFFTVFQNEAEDVQSLDDRAELPDVENEEFLDFVDEFLAEDGMDSNSDDEKDDVAADVQNGWDKPLFTGCIMSVALFIVALLDIQVCGCLLCDLINSPVHR